MAEAYIVEAVRTPVGRRNGGLSEMHTADIGAVVLNELVERTGIDPGNVDDVVWGCLDQLGSQAGNIGRTTLLVAGWPEHVPGVTIDRQCGSSQQSLHFAAQGVMSGTQDLVVAGGAQNMSQIPIASAMVVAREFGITDPYSGSEGWMARYQDANISQFRGAELIAEKWDISRQDMEEFALQSHQRAIDAIDSRRFEPEIVPTNGVKDDEGPRRDTSLEAMAKLPALAEGGRVTAAVASQISDGASAMLVASEDAVKKYNLEPRARVHHISVRGDDPVMMLSAPIPATRHALEVTGLSKDDIDLVEINEAFAPVVLAWSKELDWPLDNVNVNGGAIALGHPLG
ncbi:MAG TPA: acetyl-CoA C-acyltransferase, partial [Nitriliruptorales bacterium]